MKKFLFISALVFAGLMQVAQVDAKYIKSISILGDSYSTYGGYLTPDTNLVWYPDQPGRYRNNVNSVTKTWWHQLIKNNGYKLCRNNSYSGSTICNTGYVDKKTGKHQDYTNCSFITRLDNLGNPDIILVCGGTNDSWAGAPIGEYKYGEWTKQDLYEFRPAMAYLLDGLINHYPNVEIYFILNSELKESINESCREVCKHYNVPIIELKDIDKERNHPSVEGMKSFAEQVAKGIK